MKQIVSSVKETERKLEWVTMPFIINVVLLSLKQVRK